MEMRTKEIAGFPACCVLLAPQVFLCHLVFLPSKDTQCDVPGHFSPLLHHQWPSRALSWVHGRHTWRATFPSVYQMSRFPGRSAKSNWDPCKKISQTRTALIVSGRRVSLGLSNWQAWGQPTSRGKGPFSPMEEISRMAEGRRETELSWPLPEIGPTTGITWASHTLARVEANTVLECEGQGSCPLACRGIRFGYKKVNHQINLSCFLPMEVTLLYLQRRPKRSVGEERHILL